MEGDLSEGGLTSVTLSDGSPSDVNGQSMTYNPTAPSALGFGNPSNNCVPHTRPDSLPHYNNGNTYTSNSTGNTSTNNTVTGTGLVTSPTMQSSGYNSSSGMTASMSVPNSLDNSSGLNSSSVPANSRAPVGSLHRSNSTMSSGPTPSTKIENIKSWSISTYKCTKQLLAEKLGKSNRTVDTELEGSIESLRDTQRKYSQVLRMARALASHFYHVVSTQQQLGDAFAELAQKSPELQEEFIYNAETQRTLSKNGETLLNALNFFVSSVNTLCNKTMEDTLATIKQYEQARIEYDAYRTDLESLSSSPRSQVSSIKLDEAQRNFDHQKGVYDQLRADVAVKLQFLNENKVKVMHKQLLLFHNAVSAYFTGNEAQLEATLKQFNIKMKPPNTAPPSWLEQTVPEAIQETFQTIFGETSIQKN